MQSNGPQSTSRLQKLDIDYKVLLIDYKVLLIDYKRLQKSDIDYKNLLIPLTIVIDIYLLGPLLTKGYPKSACCIHSLKADI